MAIITRQITGPIETPEHEVVTTGQLRIDLTHPIADDDTFIAPISLEYDITDGDLPATCKVAAPGKYEFRISDAVNSRIWSFQVCVYDSSADPISLAQLWLISRLEDGDCPQSCEGLDAASLGSDGAPDGYVLTADGTGGTEWLPTGVGVGDMLKAVYDTNDDGRVNYADHALLATQANNADTLEGYPASAFHPKIVDAINDGAVLTWNDTLNEYTPNEFFLIGPGGEITLGEVHLGDTYLDESLYGNVVTVNSVYYEIDEGTHILVIIEDDAEVVLPDATAEDRRVINIKRTSDNAYDVTVSVDGGGLIEGATTFILEHKYDAITCVAINDEWWIY